MISKEFERKLFKMIEGDKVECSRPLVVGSPSEAMIKCGAKGNEAITITKSVIDKAMRPEIRDNDGRLKGNTGHGLTAVLLINAIKELESPTMIMKGRIEGSILAITSVKDGRGRNVVVAIELDRGEGFTQVISIRSVYGRDNLAYFIEDNIKKDNLIAMNKQKADELLRSIGKSYPKENTFISYN